MESIVNIMILYSVTRNRIVVSKERSKSNLLNEERKAGNRKLTHIHSPSVLHSTSILRLLLVAGNRAHQRDSE